MTPFQFIFGALLGSLLLMELGLQAMRLTRFRVSFARSLVWTAALVAIMNPGLLQAMAIRLRIGRGADFLLYLLAILFPLVTFYFLHAIERQRQQLTRMVRELALRDPLHQPERGGDEVPRG